MRSTGSTRSAAANLPTCARRLSVGSGPRKRTGTLGVEAKRRGAVRDEQQRVGGHAVRPAGDADEGVEEPRRGEPGGEERGPGGDGGGEGRRATHDEHGWR